jgi:hypothetical protein
MPINGHKIGTHDTKFAVQKPLFSGLFHEEGESPTLSAIPDTTYSAPVHIRPKLLPGRQVPTPPPSARTAQPYRFRPISLEKPDTRA